MRDRISVEQRVVRTLYGTNDCVRDRSILQKISTPSPETATVGTRKYCKVYANAW